MATETPSGKNKGEEPSKSKKIEPVPTPIPANQPMPKSSRPALEEDEELVDFGSLPAEGGSSLAKSKSQVSGPLSGTSVMSWADLLLPEAGNPAPAESQEIEPIVIDGASDHDLLIKALSDEPPSGKLKVDGNEPMAAEEFFEIVDDSPINSSGTNALSSMRGDSASALVSDGSSDEVEESSSVLESPDRRQAGDSSRVNLLRDVKGSPVGSSQKMQRTEEIDSPIILSPPDDDAAAEIGAPPPTTGESSAVDLGSQSVIDLPYPLGADSKLPTPGSSWKTPSRSKSSGGDSGAVDLLSTGKGTGLSSLPGLTAVGSGMRTDSGMPSTARVDYPGSRFPNWLTPFAFGILVTVATGTGFWLTGALDKSTGGNKTQPIAKVPTGNSENGVSLLEAGELDRAIDTLGKTEATPQTREALGQARLLRYLRECKSKGVAPGENEATQQAEADLKAAATPAAALWLGLLSESLGKTDAAKASYEDGLTRFKDQAKLFQAALDRLETRSTKSNGPRAANDGFGAAIFTLLLQAEPAVPDEAGIEFWKALRLAKENKYTEAQAALKQARDAHDVRRFALARKGQNPLSDPLEDIFLRCCDELRDHWTLRNQLHTSGYDLTKQGATAVLPGALASAKKNADDVKLLNTRLASIRDALSQSGFDLNDLPGAVNKVVKAKEKLEDAIKKANTERTSAEQAKIAAEKAKTTVETDLQTTKAQLTDAEATRQKLDDDLKKTKDQLAAMKPGPAVPAGNADVAKLQQERQALETRAKELEELLSAAKASGDRAQSRMQELLGFLQAVAQKVEAAPGARSADVLVTLEQALAAKPQRPDLPPLSPGALSFDPRAERAFARGLVRVRNSDWAAAERDFTAAVGFNSLDARYWYFLGLSKANQGRAEQADADFRQGFDRERRNLPNPSTIDASFERLSPEARKNVGSRTRPGLKGG